MESKEICFLLLFGLRSVFCFPYEYHFINTTKTWPQAQQYCREHYDDMATFTSMEDIQRVKRPSNYEFAWIGLHDDPASWRGVMGDDFNSWRWSATGTSLGGYQAWETNQPDFGTGTESCVLMRNGLWIDENCARTNFFVCFRGSLQPGSKQFILVESSKSWSDAVAYCRARYVDLAVIEDASDLTTISNLIGNENPAWIGLSREPFTWSDNRISHFKNWIRGEPDNKFYTEPCVVEYEDATYPWLDTSCARVYPVICQTAVKNRTTLGKMELQSAADLTDPVINAQILEKVSKMFKNLTHGDVKVSLKIVKKRKEDKTPANC